MTRPGWGSGIPIIPEGGLYIHLGLLDIVAPEPQTIVVSQSGIIHNKLQVTLKHRGTLHHVDELGNIIYSR